MQYSLLPFSALFTIYYYTEHCFLLVIFIFKMHAHDKKKFKNKMVHKDKQIQVYSYTEMCLLTAL